MGKRTDSQRKGYLANYARTCMQQHKISAERFRNREKLGKPQTFESILASLGKDGKALAGVFHLLNDQYDTVAGQLIAGASFTIADFEEAAAEALEEPTPALGDGNIKGSSTLYVLACTALTRAIARHLYDDLVELRNKG